MLKKNLILFILLFCFQICKADISVYYFKIEGNLTDQNNKAIPEKEFLIFQGSRSLYVKTDKNGKFEANTFFIIPCKSGRKKTEEKLLELATRSNGKNLIFYFIEDQFALVGKEIWKKRYLNQIARESKETINIIYKKPNLANHNFKNGILFFSQDNLKLIDEGTQLEKLNQKLIILSNIIAIKNFDFNASMRFINEFSYLTEYIKIPHLKYSWFVNIDNLKMTFSFRFNKEGEVTNLSWSEFKPK